MQTCASTAPLGNSAVQHLSLIRFSGLCSLQVLYFDMYIIHTYTIKYNKNEKEKHSF